MKETDNKKPNKNEKYKNLDAPFHDESFGKSIDSLLVMKLVRYYLDTEETKWNQDKFLAWIKATLEAGKKKKK